MHKTPTGPCQPVDPELFAEREALSKVGHHVSYRRPAEEPAILSLQGMSNGDRGRVIGYACFSPADGYDVTGCQVRVLWRDRSLDPFNETYFDKVDYEALLAEEA